MVTVRHFRGCLSSKWRVFGAFHWFLALATLALSLSPKQTKNKLLLKKIWKTKSPIHPKLYNINLHNVTHSLISQNPRERMFVVQISPLIVTFLSLISQNLSLMQTTQAVNPHPRLTPCVNMWSVTFLLLLFSFYLLNVDACVRHIIQEGQAEWPH